jgi:peptidoglycan/LPS O-acetylase OafA/YrhL
MLLHPRRLLGLALSILFLMGPVSRLVVLLAAPERQRIYFDFVLFCRLDTLAAGVILAWLLRAPVVRNAIMEHRTLLPPLAGTLFLVFCVIAYFENSLQSPITFTLGHSYRAIMFVFFLLVALFGSRTNAGSILRLGLFRDLGLISYGLFLFHQPVYVLLYQALHGKSDAGTSWDRWIIGLNSFFLTGLLASVCWIYIEKPVIAWSKARPLS